MERQGHNARKNTAEGMAAKVSFLVDTCIFIDYLRGEESVYSFFSADDSVDLSMSTITMMELMIGAKNKLEIQQIKKAFKKIPIIYLDENISKIGQDLVETYSKSHNLQIQDALIAATAMNTGATLITYNKSDFHYIPNLQLF